MSIKLVAIDIDGTLVTDNKEVTPAVKSAISAAKAQGVHIVLCTGRPLPGVHRYLDELELNDNDDYVITYNGSLVQESLSGKKISSHTLSYEDFLEIETMSRRLNVHLHTITDEAIYTANRDISYYTVNEAFWVKMPLRYRTVQEMTPELNIIKMMYIDEPDYLTEVINRIPADFAKKYTMVRSDTFYYEILNRDASKGAGLKALAAHLQLAPEEVMAIGDNENDLSMIEFAGTGVAMGNAVDTVKAAADIVAPSNEEDGVAHIIQEYVLK